MLPLLLFVDCLCDLHILFANIVVYIKAQYYVCCHGNGLPSPQKSPFNGVRCLLSREYCLIMAYLSCPIMVFHKFDLCPRSVSERRGFGASAGFSRQHGCVFQKRKLWISNFSWFLLLSWHKTWAVVACRGENPRTDATDWGHCPTFANLRCV